MNIYGSAAVHAGKNQVSVLQTSIRNGSCPEEALKEKERQGVMNAEIEYCTEKRHPLKKGDGG